ncbi:hypothetical protein GKE62_14520 [Novosphingobium sp. Gsoil 351]|nr:hypothetical protein GKE62_14520 [Novosphingobium sp. Gsoil 351]
MVMPPLGPDGKHLTVIRGLSDDQRLWYFRSAWNVAALNCIGPEFQPILDGYGTFLKGNAKALKAVNARIDKGFRADYPAGRDAIKAREKQMTIVYNFFALPPARAGFCQAALQVAALAAAMPKPDAMALSANFPLFEAPFEAFFNAYDQYQRDAAAWDAQYGARYGASQPGYVAVQAARLKGIPQVGQSNPLTTTTITLPQSGVVTDQETGAQIPVIPVPKEPAGIPVVQPVPQATPKPAAKP